MENIREFVSKTLPHVKSLNELPHVVFLKYPIPQDILPSLYKFV